MLIRQRGAKQGEILIHRRTLEEVVQAVQVLEARGFECVRKIQKITHWRWEAAMKKKKQSF